MTPEHNHPAGLLTAAERQSLTDPEASTTDSTVNYQRVRDRLRAALKDCQVLYPTLRDTDIAAVFCPDNEREQQIIKASTQDALGLLTLGMLRNDDLIEIRIADAIRAAALASGEMATVELELFRDPMPTVEQFHSHVDTDGLTKTTLAAYEQLLWESNAAPSKIAAVSNELGFEMSAADIQAAYQTPSPFVRPPQAAVVQIDATQPDETTSK